MPDATAKKIRILRVCPAPGHLKEFRQKYRLQGEPYDDQVGILQAENVYLPGGWQSCMEKLGFEVFDCLYDDDQLAAQ